MENGARMILQKLPEENRQVSQSQAQPAAFSVCSKLHFCKLLVDLSPWCYPQN